MSKDSNTIPQDGYNEIKYVIAFSYFDEKLESDVHCTLQYGGYKKRAQAIKEGLTNDTVFYDDEKVAEQTIKTYQEGAFTDEPYISNTLATALGENATEILRAGLTVRRIKRSLKFH
jgi:hypothetical protein